MITLMPLENSAPSKSRTERAVSPPLCNPNGIVWSLDIFRQARIANLDSPGGRSENSPPFEGWVWSLDIFRYARIGNLASPEGRFENSPLFQGWVRKDGALSPEGTAELFPFVLSRDAAHERPKPVAKFRCDERPSLLGAENTMRIRSNV